MNPEQFMSDDAAAVYRAAKVARLVPAHPVDSEMEDATYKVAIRNNQQRAKRARAVAEKVLMPRLKIYSNQAKVLENMHREIKGLCTSERSLSLSSAGRNALCVVEAAQTILKEQK